MEKLKGTYLILKEILGEDIEPLESVQLVEEYRRYWRPENVKIILLAESHLFTSDEDRSIMIQPLPQLLESPMQYARFVYCLGYGEKSLTKSHLHPRRDGTPPYTTG